ncbi:MAG: hypothetical protein F6J93_09440 [Oscillatoria sp. SIO1A7]|nr:hypothetical protein [Oscillatoria sp. SIO1A7]
MPQRAGYAYDFAIARTVNLLREFEGFDSMPRRAGLRLRQAQSSARTVDLLQESGLRLYAPEGRLTPTTGSGLSPNAPSQFPTPHTLHPTPQLLPNAPCPMPYINFLPNLAERTKHWR